MTCFCVTTCVRGGGARGRHPAALLSTCRVLQRCCQAVAQCACAQCTAYPTPSPPHTHTDTHTQTHTDTCTSTHRHAPFRPAPCSAGSRGRARCARRASGAQSAACRSPCCWSAPWRPWCGHGSRPERGGWGRSVVLGGGGRGAGAVGLCWVPASRCVNVNACVQRVTSRRNGPMGPHSFPLPPPPPPHTQHSLLLRTSNAMMSWRPVAARAILTAFSTASLPLLQ